jgi:hypothetical protein
MQGKDRRSRGLKRPSRIASSHPNRPPLPWTKATLPDRLIPPELPPPPAIPRAANHRSSPGASGGRDAAARARSAPYASAGFFKSTPDAAFTDLERFSSRQVTAPRTMNPIITP